MNKQILTVQKLKKDLWKLFSIFIRLRDTDKNGWGYCKTCQRTIFWKRGQAGHFLPGRTNTILFHEDLTHLQCYHCNIHLRGNSREYDKFMRKKYGNKKVEEFDKLGKYHKNIKQFTIQELQNLIISYKEKVKKLLENKTFELKI